MAVEAISDRLFLKDGTTEESDRIWESEKYVHFILKGTTTVEIRYAKEIVERIEQQGAAVKEISAQPADKERPQVQKPAEAPFIKPVQPAQVEVARQPVQQASNASAPPLDHNMVALNRNLKFYDPRREQRYWAGRSSKHATMMEAISALAKQYGKSTAWIEENLGEENDLGLIHERIIAALAKEAATTHEVKTSLTPPVPLFYDSSLSIPSYQTQTGSTQPVAEEIPAGSHLPAMLPSIAPGTPFYDPRRPEKFWIDDQTHHGSLQEALKSMANLYGVTPEWIENHMGKTNDLLQIHQNIRKSLEVN